MCFAFALQRWLLNLLYSVKNALFGKESFIIFIMSKIRDKGTDILTYKDWTYLQMHTLFLDMKENVAKLNGAEISIQSEKEETESMISSAWRNIGSDRILPQHWTKSKSA